MTREFYVGHNFDARVKNVCLKHGFVEVPEPESEFNNEVRTFYYRTRKIIVDLEVSSEMRFQNRISKRDTDDKKSTMIMYAQDMKYDDSLFPAMTFGIDVNEPNQLHTLDGWHRLGAIKYNDWTEIHGAWVCVSTKTDLEMIARELNSVLNGISETHEERLQKAVADFIEVRNSSIKLGLPEPKFIEFSKIAHVNDSTLSSRVHAADCGSWLTMNSVDVDRIKNQGRIKEKANTGLFTLIWNFKENNCEETALEVAKMACDYLLEQKIVKGIFDVWKSLKSNSERLDLIKKCKKDFKYLSKNGHIAVHSNYDCNFDYFNESKLQSLDKKETTESLVSTKSTTNRLTNRISDVTTPIKRTKEDLLVQNLIKCSHDLEKVNLDRMKDKLLDPAHLARIRHISSTLSSLISHFELTGKTPSRSLNLSN